MRRHPTPASRPWPCRVRLHLAVVGALACLLASCAGTPAYTGAAPADGQLAVIVPDSPRLRAWDNPLGDAGGHGGQVYLSINGQRLSGGSNRFEVKPGRVDMQVIFRDHQTPVAQRRLQTKPVRVAFDAAAGHTYRVRGIPSYPPASSALRRTADASQYRVILAVQDAETGQIVQQVNVPPSANELVLDD